MPFQPLQKHSWQQGLGGCPIGFGMQLSLRHGLGGQIQRRLGGCHVDLGKELGL